MFKRTNQLGVNNDFVQSMTSHLDFACPVKCNPGVGDFYKSFMHHSIALLLVKDYLSVKNFYNVRSLYSLVKNSVVKTLRSILTRE